ncbi:hypothetical protein FIBSPDRAFT_896568 [Athelia psychrophila]|uniref:Uncharacterized protein n=1 Tax=Athelia psychrophila TaxID=1759441 RepID=A0A166D8K1_9AGAM|nr:hypothetical protein FIBSPDRAFT_896568 [Fibularhizoctonia sp. CBS 109695]
MSIDPIPCFIFEPRMTLRFVDDDATSECGGDGLTGTSAGHAGRRGARVRARARGARARVKASAAGRGRGGVGGGRGVVVGRGRVGGAGAGRSRRELRRGGRGVSGLGGGAGISRSLVRARGRSRARTLYGRTRTTCLDEATSVRLCVRGGLGTAHAIVPSPFIRSARIAEAYAAPPTVHTGPLAVRRVPAPFVGAAEHIPVVWVAEAYYPEFTELVFELFAGQARYLYPERPGVDLQLRSLQRQLGEERAELLEQLPLELRGPLGEGACVLGVVAAQPSRAFAPRGLSKHLEELGRVQALHEEAETL